MTKRVKRKRNKKTTAGQTKQRKLAAFFKNERVQFIFGIIIAFVGIFGLLTITSFFFTGAADQSLVINKSFFELINEKEIEIQNWTGAGGAYIAQHLVNNWFGIFSILIPAFIIYLGLKIMRVSNTSFIKMLLLTAYGLISGSITSAFILGKLFPSSHINWGGTHGTKIQKILENSIGWPGLVLLVILFVTIAFILLRKSSMYKMQDTLVNSKPNFKSKEQNNNKIDDTLEESKSKEKKPSKLKIAIQNLWHKIKDSFKSSTPPDEIDESEETETETEPQSVFTNDTTIRNKTQSIVSEDDFEIVVPSEEEISVNETPSETIPEETEEQTDENEEPLEDYDPKKDLSAFQFPTMDLLKVYNTNNKAVDMEEQKENKNKIINTLRNYGIEITSIKATVGPTITLYEIIPQAGVRISKIRNLEDDIALSLSALGIRIIAPMPGKGTIGIEVPNKDPQIVSMQSVISSKKFQECTYDLPVALGKTITNEVFIFDLTKMPHLLVAGATGQGKSVGLNAIITSLLYKKHPSEMKMVLIDPKMVEFNIYSTIEKHYLAKLPDEEKAIITDVTKVTQTLNSLTKEMDDRYELLMRAKVRTIKEYNEKFVKRRLNPNKGHRYLPYMVVVIDEFGDLIMTAGKEIEMPIARIAQKARAVGMHMVIATQRPTTNIITGTIKANFPARMAFRVTSQIDSRTILDMNGANQLIGRGDMLFSQGSNLIRIQCAFVDTPEVEEIAQYIGSQRGYESAFALPEVLAEGSSESREAMDMNDRDALFDEAARLIVVHQQGSTSLIQRKFSIGYNRAGRLMDQLEQAGIVGPVQGSKPRDVYIQDEYSLEKLLDSLR